MHLKLSSAQWRSFCLGGMSSEYLSIRHINPTKTIIWPIWNLERWDVQYWWRDRYTSITKIIFIRFGVWAHRSSVKWYYQHMFIRIWWNRVWQTQKRKKKKLIGHKKFIVTPGLTIRIQTDKMHTAYQKSQRRTWQTIKNKSAFFGLSWPGKEGKWSDWRRFFWPLRSSCVQHEMSTRFFCESFWIHISIVNFVHIPLGYG